MSRLCFALITAHEQSMFVSYYWAWAVYVLFLITEHEQYMFGSYYWAWAVHVCFLLLCMSSLCLALITAHEQSMFGSFYCAWAVYVWILLLRMNGTCHKELGRWRWQRILQKFVCLTCHCPCSVLFLLFNKKRRHCPLATEPMFCHDCAWTMISVLNDDMYLTPPYTIYRLKIYF